MYVVCGSLLGLTFALAYISYLERKRHDEQMIRVAGSHSKEKEEWNKERQQLLDRIQSPSFAEYKHAEVKTIKAQQGIKEPPPLEPM